MQEKQEGYWLYDECPDIDLCELEYPCEYDGKELIRITASETHFALTRTAAEDMAACINYLCGREPVVIEEPLPEESTFLTFVRGMLYVTIGVCYLGVMALVGKWIISLM